MKKFIPVEFLGSAFEIDKICKSTVATLEREFRIKISQEVIVPAIVDTFIDAAMYESIQFKKKEIRKELNLFNLLRVVHEIVPEEKYPLTIVSLGRMGMRKLEMDFDKTAEENGSIETNIVDIDIKLLEKISMRASSYIEDRHHLAIRDYQIIFKVAEVFFDELLSYIKINDIAEATLTVFDQFTLVLDDNGKFESIELTESLQSTLNIVYDGVVEEINRLSLDDDDDDSKEVSSTGGANDEEK